MSKRARVIDEETYKLIISTIQKGVSTKNEKCQ